MNYSRIRLNEYCVISVWFGCNNDCTICMLSDVRESLPLPTFETFSQVIVSIVDQGRFRNLILSGAEVTTFPELDRYVRLVASTGWFEKIQIQTNGRRLRDRDYLEHLIDCGVNEFYVSIHGLEATQDRLTRKPGSFGEAMAGLANLSQRANFDRGRSCFDARYGRNIASADRGRSCFDAQCGRNIPAISVISNTVVTKANLSDIPALIRLLSGDSAVSEMQLWNYFPMEERDSKDLVVGLASLVQILPELASYAESAGKALVLKGFPECLSLGPPVFFDNFFPVTVLPDLFWKHFGKSGFGKCLHRESGTCHRGSCWGLSSAYIHEYGEERELLRPMAG